MHRRTIERESAKLSVLINQYRADSQLDEHIAYGARQALEWVLDRNAMKVSKLTTLSNHGRPRRRNGHGN